MNPPNNDVPACGAEPCSLAVFGSVLIFAGNIGTPLPMQERTVTALEPKPMLPAPRDLRAWTGCSDSSLGRQIRLRQGALDLAGTDVDDSDGSIVAVDECFTIPEGQAPDSTLLTFDGPHELSGRDVPEPDLARAA